MVSLIYWEHPINMKQLVDLHLRFEEIMGGLLPLTHLVILSGKDFNSIKRNKIGPVKLLFLLEDQIPKEGFVKVILQCKKPPQKRLVGFLKFNKHDDQVKEIIEGEVQQIIGIETIYLQAVLLQLSHVKKIQIHPI
jgi:hypothetical protein